MLNALHRLSAAPAARAASGGWYSQVESDDVDGHGRQAATWRLHYDQLGAGKFHGEFRQVQLPSLLVFREVTNQRVRQQGDLGPGRFALALPVSSSTSVGGVQLNGRTVSTDRVLIVNDAPVDLCTPTSFELVGVDADRAQLQAVLADLRPDQDVLAARHFGDAEFDPGTARRLLDLLTLVHETARLAPWMLQAPQARQQLADTVLLEVAEVLPQPRTWCLEPQALRRKKLVDRACERMLAQPDDPPSLLEVCREVGASRRKLTDCFQEALGTSPAQYLRVVRLNGARRTLQSADPSIGGVYDAAVRWGFWHFGEFSAAYRAQFGERPSETLRRARGLVEAGRAAGPASRSEPPQDHAVIRIGSAGIR